MAVSTKNIDPAFQGVGQKAGTDIWRIEDFRPVPVPKSEYGKFYTGDSYIVLKTVALKSGGFHYDVHFWLGKDTSQDEAGTAAIKTVELDAALGGRAVQYRELQGHETDIFLSYFKPCIIPLEGGVASGFKKVEAEKYEPQLYVCKGRRVARVKRVLYARSSLNHDDVFILDTEFKIYQFNGSTSSIQERAKALEVVQYIKDTYHEGKCEVAVIDDGKLVAEEDSGEFWGLFGGFAPIGRKGGNDDDLPVKSAPAKLYCIADGQLVPVENLPLSKGLLDSNKCYLLDCGSDVYVWVGRITSIEQRKAAGTAAEEFVSGQQKSKSVCITRVIQGFEPLAFRTQFEEWPLGSGTVSEDGRVKVAALLKQQGVNVKGIMKAGTSKEDIPPLLNANGKLEVWRINGTKKTALASTEVGKFYSGDCYIVLYTYPGERRDEFYLCHWIGKDSVQEEQASALRLATQMSNSLKGRPVQGRITQGKEPAQFIGLFENLIILKGGLSSGYRKEILEKGIDDETYKEDGTALFRVQGTGPHNKRSTQVELDGSCLNSSDCFILQTGSTVFLWNGSASTSEDQQWASNIVEYLKPGTTPKIVKEGSEPATFWNPLGGKKSHANRIEGADGAKDPHLFSCSLVNGKLQVSEVFNFAQDDLLSEDLMILDMFNELFVWVGQHADSTEKQQAFEIAEKYLERADRLEEVPLDIPIFKVTEGNEPLFFTIHFSNWDPIKASVQGDSFEKRLASVLGRPIHSLEQTPRQSPSRRTFSIDGIDLGSNGKTSTSPKLFSQERSGPTQRAAAMASLIRSLSEERKVVSSRSPLAKIHSTASVISGIETESVLKVEAMCSVESLNPIEAMSEISSSETSELGVTEKSEEVEPWKGYASYERLKVKSSDPIPGIDPTKRESYLSPEDFEKIFKMEVNQFYALPKWKQDRHKRAVDLF